MYYKKQHFLDFLKQGKTAEFTRLSSKAGILENEDIFLIIYIDTIVFYLDKKTNEIWLNTNGWTTMTSKKWINYGLNKFSQYKLIQKNFSWYITRNIPHLIDETIEYKDNMKL